MSSSLLKKLFLFSLFLTAIGCTGFGAWTFVQWNEIAEAEKPLEAGLELIRNQTIPVYAIVTLGILTYLFSLDGRRARRPYGLIILSSFLAAAPVGLLIRTILSTHGFIVGETTRESEVPLFDLYAAGAILGAGVLLTGLILLFEIANRRLWSSLAQYFDSKDQSGLALSSNRLALLFRPGQQAMLRSVALARFRKGVRGDAALTLQGLYDAGERDPDILEALCKYSSEQNNQDDYLRYLRELHEQLPDEEEIQEALVDVYIDQRRHAEALVLMEKAGVPETEDALERYATVLLAEGHVERAAQVAKELGDVEGIPFRRSQKLLREILSRMSEYVPALNTLAAQADRMALREQKIRWLEKSLQANPRQRDVREELIVVYRDLGNNQGLELLLDEQLYDNPKDKELLFEYITVLARNEKFDDALNRLEELNARNDAQARGFLLEAQIRFDARQWEEAKKAAQQGLEKRPNEEELRRLNLLLSRVEKAVLTAEVATAVDEAREHPESLELQLYALQKLIDGGHAEKVVRMTDELLTAHPKSRPTVTEMLQIYAQRPDVPFSILNLLSDMLAAANRLDEVLEVVRLMGNRSLDKVSTIRDGVQKILRRSPHHLATLRFLGDTYLAHGRFTEMIHSYSLYLSTGGEETELINRSLAKAYISLGDYENARRFVNQLLQINPNDDQLLRQIVPLALDADQPEDAAEFLKKLEIIDPRDTEVKKLKERVQAGLGERRFSFLKRELEAGKGSTEILEQLGDIAREMANYNEAITYFQRASRDQVDANRARRCTAKLAYCYLKKRLDDLASETLKEIRISLDDDPKELKTIMDLLYEIGELFLEAKIYHKAEAVFKQLCKIDAGYKDVLLKVEKLRV